MDKPIRKISLAEPVTEVRRVPIQDNGEPLVDYLKAAPLVVPATPRFKYKRETLVRATVADMLRKASESLPSGYKLAVVEGWRPPHIQRRMYMTQWNRWKERHPEWSDAQIRRVANRYTAPLHGRVPPPHSTGGAVDFALQGQDGTELDMMSPFTRLNPQSFSLVVAGLSDEAQRNRDILANALTKGGLTNYPSEYWHWTYGDQGWAYRGGHPYALYGATEPPGYKAPEEDDNDVPFEFLIK
ncbi:MAG: zinc D-Ala-D-Ala dipeptidase [Fimbriimonadaceae bacterium]|nr:zinc D-Ala-D-Ala dipeptidase [Fimbriimonadaceae bacterium]